MAGLHFRATAAAGYDRTVGQMTQRIVPSLLRAPPTSRQASKYSMSRQAPVLRLRRRPR
jgi:hypothetical protein